MVTLTNRYMKYRPVYNRAAPIGAGDSIRIQYKPSVVSPYWNYAGYLGFNGITIPNGASISSAVLNLHAVIYKYGTFPSVEPVNGNIRIMADKRKTPTLNYFGAGNTITNIFKGNTNPTVILNEYALDVITNSTTNTSPPNKTDFSPLSIDVTNIVSSLTTSYEYDNGKMVLFVAKDGTHTGLTKALVYAEGWEPTGTTAPYFTGGGAAKLEITYTPRSLKRGTQALQRGTQIVFV